MRYQTILFDADNTLLDFTRSEHDALYDCLAARGLPCGEDAIARYSAINDAYWKRLERGEVTRAALKVGRFADFLAEYGLHCDPAALANEYMQALSTKSYLIDGAEALCRRLTAGAQPCRLYLITNGTEFVQHGRFDPSPLAPLFHACFISECMGCEKPDVAYFHMVTSAIPAFEPASTLVVGDSLSSDIRGGIAAGLDTCWFNPHGKACPSDVAPTYTCTTLAEVGDIVCGACK